MSEFKGTKEIIIDEGSIYKPPQGFINVKLTDSEGWPVATVWAKDFEKLKANAVLFSKAPEMLEMLETMKKELYWCINKLQEYGEEVDFQTIAEVNQLIKQATE
ncbi:hypothetical protein CMU45_02755 [Elizabethkingia anophelis]|nr:hypothetical protein [Elizabethkingia anophelis]